MCRLASTQPIRQFDWRFTRQGNCLTLCLTLYNLLGALQFAWRFNSRIAQRQMGSLFRQNQTTITVLIFRQEHAKRTLCVKSAVMYDCAVHKAVVSTWSPTTKPKDRANYWCWNVLYREAEPWHVIRSSVGAQLRINLQYTWESPTLHENFVWMGGLVLHLQLATSHSTA